MHSHVKLQSIWIICLDALCLLASILLALYLRFGAEDMVPYVLEHLDGWVLFFVSIVFANYMAGSYRVQYSFSRFNMLVTWLFSMTFAVIILSLTSFAWFKILLGRGVLALAAVFYSVLSLYLRVFFIRAMFSAGRVVKRVVIVGRSREDRRLRDYLENPFIVPQYRLIAWISVDDPAQRRPAKACEVVDGCPVVEASCSELPDAVQSLNAEVLVLGRTVMSDLSTIYEAIRQVRFRGVDVMTPLTVTEVYCGRIPLDMVNEQETMNFGEDSALTMMLRVKRLIDLAVASVGCILFTPVMLVTALVIKMSEPGSPVFYSQERVGRFGRIFKIHKFRTMRAGAEDQSGAVWSWFDDPRVTRPGKILRKFRIDELPQFWNVLVGEMSLVGPRPERPELTAMLGREIPFYSEREYVLPGISGWAQIHYPYGNSVESARRKLEYDLYYLKNMSPSLDLQIILRTLRTVLFGREYRA